MSKIIEAIKALPLPEIILVCIIMHAVVFGPELAHALIVFFCFLSLSYDKYEVAREKEREDLFVDQNLTMIQNQIEEIQKDHKTVLRVAEDAKKIVGELNLAKTFQRPTRQ